MSEELVCHFGKHEGERIGEIPGGYLKWAVENIDPVPLMKYRKNDDGSMKSVEKVKAMEDAMRTFLSAAEDEITKREDEHVEEK